MLPCFLAGLVSLLLASISRALIILGRAASGSITSSTYPRAAATLSLIHISIRLRLLKLLICFGAYRNPPPTPQLFTYIQIHLQNAPQARTPEKSNFFWINVFYLYELISIFKAKEAALRQPLKQHLNLLLPTAV